MPQPPLMVLLLVLFLFPMESPNRQSPFTAGNSFSYKDATLNKRFHTTLSWEEVLDVSFDISEDDLKPKQCDLAWPCVPISLQEYLEYSLTWRKTLIIKTLGKSIGYNFMVKRLRQLWKLQESFSLVDLGKDYFLVLVNNPDDYWQVLTGGPWVIAGYYLTVQRWKPLFNPNIKDIRSAAMWVRLPGLPIELFEDKVVWTVGNKLGHMVKVDVHTEESSRRKYARLCVEIDLSKPLVRGLLVGGKWQRVEYEGLDVICFDCGVYGHQTFSCP